MRLYLDTEFNGHGGELISIALVGPGHQFYGATLPVAPIDPWVAEHVMPVLQIGVTSLTMLRTWFQAFIIGLDDPEIICDWHADAEHFCRLLEGPDYGSSLDFPFRLRVLKTPPGQPKSALPHNALSDALALWEWHNNEEINDDPNWEIT